MALIIPVYVLSGWVSPCLSSGIVGDDVIALLCGAERPSVNSAVTMATTLNVTLCFWQPQDVLGWVCVCVCVCVCVESEREREIEGQRESKKGFTQR